MAQHLGKYASLLSCPESDEKTDACMVTVRPQIAAS